MQESQFTKEQKFERAALPTVFWPNNWASAWRPLPSGSNAGTLKTDPPEKKGVCDTCQVDLVQRPDDKEEVIRNRLVVYVTETQPLVEYYRQKGIYHKVDAQGSHSNVFDRITSIIDDYTA